MKCKICGKKTTWDESYGRPNFIVCPVCHKMIAENIHQNHQHCGKYPEFVATSIIIQIGRIREEWK